MLPGEVLKKQDYLHFPPEFLAVAVGWLCGWVCGGVVAAGIPRVPLLHLLVSWWKNRTMCNCLAEILVVAVGWLGGCGSECV